MDCPHCGTYNPAGRETCWRCDRELPKPKRSKKRDPQKTAQIWLYVAVAVFFIFTIAQTCGVKLPFGQVPREEQGPSGHLLRRPPIAYQIEASLDI